MALNLFGIISIQPFWKKQYIDDDYIGVKLILGLLGYISGLWILPNLLTLNFGLQFLNTINSDLGILPFYSSLLTQFSISLIITFTMAYTIQRFSTVYEGFDLRQNWKVMIHELQDTMEEAGHNYHDIKLGIILIIPVVFGFITGLAHSFLLSIAHFVLFFILFFLFANFVPVGSVLIILSTVISWFSTSYVLINRKLHLEDTPPSKEKGTYIVSKRNLDIIRSEEEPIICQNCRSFIPANSTVCPVCREDIS